MKKRRSQPKRRNSQKRKQNRFRLFVVLSVMNVLLLVLTVLLLPAALRNPAAEDKPSTLGVRSITVTGNTQYDNEAIIGVSELKVGQSVFSVNKGQVERDIRHAIESAWMKGDLEWQYTYFGNTIDGNRAKPTNSEFIARITEALRLEVM